MLFKESSIFGQSFLNEFDSFSEILKNIFGNSEILGYLEESVLVFYLGS